MPKKLLLTCLIIWMATLRPELSPAHCNDAPATKTYACLANHVFGLQVPFIENQGQIEAESVRYYAPTFGGTLFVTRDGLMIYCLPRFEKAGSNRGWVIRERFVNSSISSVSGETLVETNVHFFKGQRTKWQQMTMAAYRGVSFGTIYPGIGLTLKAQGNNVEKILHLKPEADYNRIQVKIDGADRLRVNAQGELEVQTPLGIVKFTKPVAYQEYSGRKNPIEVSYRIEGNSYGFKLGEYDRSRALVIDPLLASTFLGGGGTDVPYAIARDASGNVYVAGSTVSSDFPATPDVLDTDCGTDGSCNPVNRNDGTVLFKEDVFVAKLDRNLTRLIACTFLGGKDDDWAMDIALGRDGSVYLTGSAFSVDFPTTPGAYAPAHSSRITGEDAFIAKLDGDLKNLLASSFFNITDNSDGAEKLALDSSGNVYVAGNLFFGVNFAFAAKFDSSLAKRLAFRMLGSDSFLASTFAQAIVVDKTHSVFIAGESGARDFPSTAGAYDTQCGTDGDCNEIWRDGSYIRYGDAFLTKLDSSLNLLASTYLGGELGDVITGLATDENGGVYAAGKTQSRKFPTNPKCYDILHNGGWDAFLARFDGSLGNLLFSTYIGGYGHDEANALATDSRGRVYVTGSTASPNFPTSPEADDDALEGSLLDVYITIFDPKLETLLTATFLGGGAVDRAYDLMLDRGSHVYISGSTGVPSSPASFPTTSTAYDIAHNGGYDVFITKLDLSMRSDAFPLILPGLLELLLE